MNEIVPAAPLEVWRRVPGWHLYSVSDQGRVKKDAALSDDGKRKLKARLLKITRSGRNGGRYCYLSVTLGSAKKQEAFSLARLVLLAFVGEPGPGEECRHLDDNSTDCRLINLAWGSREANKKDAIQNGRTSKGENNGAAKLTQAQVAEIRQKCCPHTHSAGYAATARAYGLQASTIASIVKGQSWKTSP